MLLPYQTKQISCEIKEIDMERRLVGGYFSVFGNIDSDGDMLMKGCYAKTIQENGARGKNRIMHLLQHTPTRPLGKPFTLEEDDYGVRFQTIISDTSYGTDALKLYHDGVFTEHSVGINIIRSEYSNEDKANIVSEVKMWEGSTVTWGANELAIGGIGKSEIDAPIERYKTLSKAFYTGDYTDETLIIIEKQKNFLEEQINKALQGLAPSQDTPPNDAAKLKAFFDELQFKQTLKGVLHV